MNSKKFNVIISFSLALLITLLFVFDGLSIPETILEDNIFQTDTIPSDDIVVIGIDEDTIDELGSFSTWSRDKTADIIDILNANPKYAPAVIAIDIMFASESNPDIDKKLVDTCKKYNNVILAERVIFNKEIIKNNNEYKMDTVAINGYVEPFKELKEVVKTGNINTVLDKDGAIRNTFSYINDNNTQIKSLSYMAAQMYKDKNNTSLFLPKCDEYGIFPIRFTTFPTAYYSGNSFVKVLNGEIPVQAFKNKIVLIGAYSVGLADAYKTPIDFKSPMQGVEIHANVIDSMLSNRFFIDISKSIQAIIIFIAVFIISCLFFKFSILKSTILLIISVLVYAIIVFFASDKGIRFNLISIPLGVILSYITCIVLNYLEERKRKKQIIGKFKQYVSPDVVDSILKTTTEDIMENKHRDICIMFLDIRSFTPLAEKITPQQAVDLINEILELVTSVTFKNGGTIDKFLGDGAMILFNAPLDLPDYEIVAIRTGLEIIQGAWKISDKHKPDFDRDVMLGIGLHCGKPIVGNIGTSYRMDYTAIGDAVNTAARLEGKAPAGAVVISEDLYQRVKNRIEVESMGEMELKGKAQKMPCYKVVKIIEEEKEG